MIDRSPPDNFNQHTPSSLMVYFMSLGDWSDERFSAIVRDNAAKGCSVQAIQKWKNDNIIPSLFKNAFFRMIKREVHDDLADDWVNAFKIVWAQHKAFRKGMPTKNTNKYANIAKCNDFSLPYYSPQNHQAFFDIHLDILQGLLGENYDILHNKLLRENVDGKEIIFPAINLLETNHPLTINQQFQHKEISNTAIPTDFINAVKSFMPNVKDNNTFTLQNIDQNTNEITCSASSYLKTLYACDRWFYDMITNFPELLSQQKQYKKKNFLKKWARQLEDNIIHNRFSPDQSLGSACLCIYQTDTGYEYLLGQKSIQANAFKELHVLPSFMFQPLTQNILKFKNELSVEAKVLQELAEEIFQYEEFEDDGHGRFIFNGIYSTPQNAAILKLLKNGGAELHTTGLWLDLYRLRPEITTTLIIHDPKWFEEFFTSETKIGNWEITKAGVLDFSTDQHSYEHILSGMNGRLCPPGAAALISGMRLFNKLHPQ